MPRPPVKNRSVVRSLGQQRRQAMGTYELVQLARKHTPSAMRRIVALMDDAASPPAVQLRAAELVIERGYGKSAQSITIEDNTSTQVGARVLSIAERIIMLKMAQERGGQTLDLENSQLKLVEPVEVRPAAEDLVG